MADGEPVLGLIDAPCLDEIYIGKADGSLVKRGGTATALRVSDCTSLAEARLSTTDPFLFEGPAADGFERLRKASRQLAMATMDMPMRVSPPEHSTSWSSAGSSRTTTTPSFRW